MSIDNYGRSPGNHKSEILRDGEASIIKSAIALYENGMSPVEVSLCVSVATLAVEQALGMSEEEGLDLAGRVGSKIGKLINESRRSAS